MPGCQSIGRLYSHFMIMGADLLTEQGLQVPQQEEAYTVSRLHSCRTAGVGRRAGIEALWQYLHHVLQMHIE